MKKLVAIDIGTSKIKIITGTRSVRNVNKFKIQSVYYVDYESFFSSELVFTEDIHRNHYRSNFNSIVHAIQNALSKEAKSFVLYCTFNSRFSKIIPIKLHASSKKRLKFAANIYLEKIVTDLMEANYRIVEFDKQKNEGEILLYSYRYDVFDDLLSLVDKTTYDVSIIEFDVICLANALSANLIEDEQEQLLIDFGMSKTNILLMKGEVIEELIVSDTGLCSIIERIAQRLHINLNEAMKIFSEQQSNKLLEISEITWEELIEPYLQQIFPDIDSILQKNNIPEILIAGGFANNVTLRNSLKTISKKNIKIFNPFAKFDLDIEIKNPEQYATAFGLFLR